MLEYELVNEKVGARLLLTGDGSIENGEKLKEAFRTALDRGGNIIVDTSGLKSMDLCLVQTYIAAGKEAENMGVHLELQGKNIQDYMQRVGYQGHS
ncbi:MAG: STAS domain-containing protein [Desulfonatronovibrionaceae bacterium]